MQPQRLPARIRVTIAGEYEQHQKNRRERAEHRDDGRAVAQMRCESGHSQAESEGDGIERFVEIGEPREHPLYYDFLMSTVNDATPTSRTARITISEPWTCPTCNKTVSTPFCPGCGECPLHPRDLTLRGFLQQVALALTRVDGRLIGSVRRLVTRPGALTLAYLQGQRKLYTAPLQLFFLANVLFFAMHAVTDAKIFATPLDAHLHRCHSSPQLLL